MADLLECLIQIKGLAETPGRLSRRIGGTEACRPEPDGTRLARYVAATLALGETSLQQRLNLILSVEMPLLPAPFAAAADAAFADAGIDEWVDRFAVARRETIRLLERCTAADLNRSGLDRLRGPTTVADLVALALAHDTDQLARLLAPSGGGPVIQPDTPSRRRSETGP